MADLHEDLERLARAAGEPARFDDLTSTRRRRDHRRRLGGLAVGLAVMVAAAIFLATTLLGRTEAPPAAPMPIAWRSYTDPYGWRIEVPAGWHIRQLVTPDAGTQGALFTGDDLSIQVSTQTAAPGSVQPGLTYPATNDARFPINADALLSPTEGGLGGSFVGDGLSFSVNVVSPSLPDPLPATDAEILDRMIGSISFEPWTIDETRHDWTAIAPPTKDVSWVKIRGGAYMLFRTDSGYRLYGSITCGGRYPTTTGSTPDGFARVDCPDGSTWEMDADGASGGGGEASANDPPPEWLVATAADGTLIAYVLPGVFPPGTGGAGGG